MKNVHRYNNDSSFIAEYGGSGYSEPWVSVADNVTLVDSFTATSSNDGFTDRYTFIKRLPIGKFCVIQPYDTPNHIDYVYLWKLNRVWIGGGLAKGSTKSSNDDVIVATLTADFSNTNVSTDIEQLHYINPYTIKYMGTYTYDSISDVTTKTVSNLAYSKRVDNYEHHMSFDMADYDSTNLRIPVTLDFDVSIDSGMAPKGNTDNDNGIKILVTFQDGQTERKCFAYYPSNGNVYLSDYDTNGDLINFAVRCGKSPSWFDTDNNQLYLCFSSGIR